ncbi:hypothetical protein EZV62_011507 [Acer yangbiense]|uniref:ATP-dependent Clp protease proteolytic subunit n=1 Tax=Acer yangbiense TaxID=1000413 RepID=A0A5C7I4Q6_9ROSI|nr:hypothetical protein EZV62_011507 [Acer yangbiense]
MPEGPKKQDLKLSYQLESDLIVKRFHENGNEIRLEILKKLKEIANLGCTSLAEPRVKTKIRGRPSSKVDSSTCRDPSTFEAVADLVGYGVNEWEKVRRDLVHELDFHSEYYTRVYGSHERVMELTRILSYYEEYPGYDHWMTMPEMGYLIASCYNVALFHLSIYLSFFELLHFFSQQNLRFFSRIQPINSLVAQRVISQLVTLATIDENADILMYLNCPGGSSYSVLAIYDCMSWIKPKVGTVCFGVAASQGALLLAGGEKGMRYAMPNARIMIHQPQSGCGGEAEDVRRQVNEAIQSRHKLDRMYAAFTGQSLEKVQQYTERDRFLSVSEAMEFGLIDGILETEY